MSYKHVSGILYTVSALSWFKLFWWHFDIGVAWLFMPAIVCLIIAIINDATDGGESF